MVRTSPSASPAKPTLRSRKALGQHFLVSDRILDRIVSAADLSADDLVVEIGPGAGALTRRLLQRAGRVVAVEVDPRLAAALAPRLGNPTALETVQADARSVEIDSLAPPGVPYKVVANLPYYAANPIVRRFLEAVHKPASMTLTLQEEVARDMVAPPGKMKLLSVAVQLFAKPELVCVVPAEAFRPPPKVTSAVIRLDLRPAPAVQVDDIDAFFDLVRAGFASPRKQIRNSLAHGLNAGGIIVDRLLDAASLEGTRRPATLELEEWAGLYRAWQAQGAESQAAYAEPALPGGPVGSSA